MKKILVLDTETANTIEEPICYDIGGIIADMEGHIYKSFSFVVADVFLDKELMASAYYAEKMPKYWDEIKQGKRELRKLSHIVNVIRSLMREYDITDIYAYNSSFDERAMRVTERYMTSSKYRYFFPYGTNFVDILSIARLTLYNHSEYTEFCIKNNYLDSKNRNRHTAEIVARFFFDETFIEDHTAKEDSIIEYAILLKCLKMQNCK